MRSVGDEIWHEIAPETYRTARCAAIVRGVVHQRRTVPVEGVLCRECLAWRGVIETLPREVGTGWWALVVPGVWLPVVWPGDDPDPTSVALRTVVPVAA